MSRSISEAFFPGKLILTGEHSVVFGNLAILASLDLGVTCRVSEGDLSAEQKNDQYLAYVLKLCKNLLNQFDLKAAININSTLPVKSGLGSSAAFAAAVLSAVTEFYGLNLDQSTLYSQVVEAENFIHGRSSGADPAGAVYGGLIAFKNGEISKLDSKALSDQVFFLINSGVTAESTGEMINLVKNKAGIMETIEKISVLSQKFQSDLENGRFDHSLIDQNQDLLENLGIVGEKAKQMIETLKGLGAHCKVTGAGGLKGGSGYILAIHQDSRFFASKLKELNIEYFETKLGDSKNGDI